MKRAGKLFDKIITIDNLQLAFYKAQKGKASKKDVIEFRADLHQNISKIQSQLIDGSIKIGDYHYFVVNEPKERKICAASFPERVLHHALMNVCDPFFEKYSIFDSYACRKDKGSLKAVERARQFSGVKTLHATSNNAFVKLDISKYFDSIDHQILIERLWRLFKDKKVMEIFDKIINSYETQKGKGLPIGNLTSQHFANFYLGALDHYVKEVLKCRLYVRYMDDFVLFGESKSEMKEKYKMIKSFLNENLSLKIKQDALINNTCDGFNFLGYRIFPDTLRLSRRSKKRFKNKFKDYENKYVTGAWSESELSRRIEALLAFIKKADSKGFRNNIIQRYGAASEGF